MSLSFMYVGVGGPEDNCVGQLSPKLSLLFTVLFRCMD